MVRTTALTLAPVRYNPKTKARFPASIQDTRHTYSGKGLAIGDALAILVGDLLQGDHNETYAGEYLVVYQRNANGNLTGK